MDIDWYERRDELMFGQVFRTADGMVKLDRRVPGDGTKWYVADWNGGWAYYDSTIEPSELIGDPIEDTPEAIQAAFAADSIGEMNMQPGDAAECWPDNHGPLSNLPHDA